MSAPEGVETLEIYLRSGQTLTLNVTDWKIRKSTLSNEITELSWDMADETRLPFISLADIVAVRVAA